LNHQYPKNHPREEGTPPLEIPINLFGATFRRTLNKRPSSEYNSNPLKNESLRNHPYSHIGHQEEFKDGMSSNAIEGEPSHSEDTSILSPSIPTLDVLFGPISQSILHLDDPSIALSPKPHNDPRNPLRQTKHRSDEDHKDDQEWLRQWLECMKNAYAIVKEWMDKDEALWVESKLGLDSNREFKSIPFANMTHPSLEEDLYETNPRNTNRWEILDNKTSNE
jgi:hypothetical protein